MAMAAADQSNGTLRRDPVVIGFLLLWLILGLATAGVAELTSDEGYYWFISRRLEWGYYDHPPVLAAIIALGRWFAPGELGVRLVNVVLSSATVALALGLIVPERRARRVGLLLVAAVPLLSYQSILVFPDGPLLPLMVAFLYGYRRFLQRQDAVSLVIIGMASGLMLYAKYHGLLVIALTVVSNPRLLLSRRFMGAMALGAVIFMPHLWWQYQHDFVTFRYHLSGRASGFSFDNMWQFVSQQLYTLGPAILLVPFLVRGRDLFERALRTIALGTLVFFLLMSLRGFVHAHWTSIAVIPAVVLGAAYYAGWRRRWPVVAMTAPLVVAGLLFRLYLSYQIVPQNHVGIDYYHDRDLWAADLAEFAGQRPLVFPENFREAPLYQFYSGNRAVALFEGGHRESQYQIWQFEDSLQGSDVVWATDGPLPGSVAQPTRMGPVKHLLVVPDFESYYNLEMTAEITLPAEPGRPLLIDLTMVNHRETELMFRAGPGPDASKPRVFVNIQGSQGSETRYLTEAEDFGEVAAGSVARLRAQLATAGLAAGEYQLVFGIEGYPMGRSHNTAPVLVTLR